MAEKCNRATEEEFSPCQKPQDYICRYVAVLIMVSYPSRLKFQFQRFGFPFSTLLNVASTTNHFLLLVYPDPSCSRWKSLLYHHPRSLRGIGCFVMSSCQRSVGRCGGVLRTTNRERPQSLLQRRPAMTFLETRSAW